MLRWTSRLIIESRTRRNILKIKCKTKDLKFIFIKVWFILHLLINMLLLVVLFFINIIIELTHSKTILENIVEIEPQPVALDFKNLSQYSSRSK